jgi:MoxR-like ATPase
MPPTTNALTTWSRIEYALRLSQVWTLYLWGDPGTGKTYAALNFGRVDPGVYAVTLTPDTSASEVRGHFIMKGTDAVWHDGAFVRAMREGKRLVINEISSASPDVLALLFLILESRATARLTLPTGETIVPAPGFHVVATDNHPPDHLPEALQDRFVGIVHVSEPHPDALACLDPEMRALAEATLSIKDDRRISARGWYHLQILSREIGLHEACLLVFGAERGQMIHDAIRLARADDDKPRPKK